MDSKPGCPALAVCNEISNLLCPQSHRNILIIRNLSAVNNSFTIYKSFYAILTKLLHRINVMNWRRSIIKNIIMMSIFKNVKNIELDIISLNMSKLQATLIRTVIGCFIQLETVEFAISWETPSQMTQEGNYAMS